MPPKKFFKKFLTRAVHHRSAGTKSIDARQIICSTSLQALKQSFDVTSGVIITPINKVILQMNTEVDKSPNPDYNTICGLHSHISHSPALFCLFYVGYVPSICPVYGMC